ncbi:E3 ubiquitin-protein ligase RFWD3 [Drosophila ficusphila]|uniref:E3 ubiquitin-protein ligase RFWD3 n=1 Tax=Drosophila ficusphila TaxID=30025 RepID=UPI0007E7C855|nr:E3 ubiquitin-protein ligase RFWD3 [Drosophila ficusphila]
MNVLLEELQKLERDLGQVHLDLTTANLEEQLALVKLESAKMMFFNEKRSNILLSLQEEITNFKSIKQQVSEPEVVRIAQLCKQVKDINKELDGMYEINKCSICQMICEAEGSHCLVSLRCGHLFGRSCISSALWQAFKCPICLRGALHFHLRTIYGLKLFPF